MVEERSRIRAVQMDNLRGLIGIKRMDSLECMNKGVARSEEIKCFRVAESGGYFLFLFSVFNFVLHLL